MATETTVRSNKGATIVTYVIALLCLIAGLFAPLYGTSGSLTERMLFFYLPGVFDAATGKTLIATQGIWKPFDELYLGTFFGKECNVLAWALLVYAAITVIGILFLIPVLAGNKNKKTSAVCAYIIEVAAALTLTVYALFALSGIAGAFGWDNYAVLIALGGALLILISQSIYNKNSLGVLKFFLFLLSAIAAIALFDLTVWITALASPLDSFAGKLGATVGFVGDEIGAVYFTERMLEVQNIGNWLTGSVSEKILVLAAMITATLVVLNLLIDIIGLATGSRLKKNDKINPNKGSKIFGLVRYALEFIAALATLILLFVVDKNRLGFYLYIVGVIALVQTIIQIIRVCRLKKLAKDEEPAKKTAFHDPELDKEYTEEYNVSAPAGNASEATVTAEAEADATETAAANAEPVILPLITNDEEPQKTAEAAAPVYSYDDIQKYDDIQLEIPVEQPKKVTEENHTFVYNYNVRYNGPSDTFMETLTDDEKIEFVKVFIEKSKGKLPNIPEYEIGGDNKDFFPSVFIYLAKFRALLSAGLLGKIYKQLNLLN